MSDPTGRSGLRAFRWGWTAFVVAATSLPYLLHLLSTPPGSHYTWIVPPYPDDSLAYRAWSEQAARGGLLFRLPYTAIPHRPFVFHPFFLVAGWLSALLSCDIGVIHWVLKAVGVALFFVVFFDYAGDLRLTRFQTMTAAVLVGVSSGFGGLLALLDLARPAMGSSADLWVVDANTFWSLLWNPLFPYALALMTLAIHRLDRGTREGRTRDLWQGGLATGTLALIHPYSQPLLYVLAVVFIAVRRRAEVFAYLGRFLLPALPPALYVASVAFFHPLASRHSAQGIMTSPDLASCLLGFGLPLVLVAGGLATGPVAMLRRHWPVFAWFVLSVALSYLPFWFQRKLLFGAHVPLSILAAVSVDALVARLPRETLRRRVLVVAAFGGLPVLVATPLWLFGAEFREVRENKDSVYFVGDDLMQGLKYLEANGHPDDLVFATPWMSRLIPAFSGGTVLWGHWAMSVDRASRETWFADRFKEGAAASPETAAREFWETGTDDILVDERLRRWMERNPAAWRAVLADATQVFANDSVVIYRHR